MAYQRTEYYEPARISTGQSAVYGTLSERLREFGARARSVGDEIAVPAAQEEGAAAGLAGQTQKRTSITPAGRAYNDAMVRSYALGAFADIQTNLDRLEVEAGTDPQKFRTSVDGFRKGMVPTMLPEAQPIIDSALQMRTLEGMRRISQAQQQETRANVIAESERGRTALEDRISRAYASGDPEQMTFADTNLTPLYLGSIEGDVQAGLLTRRGADAKIDLMIKNTTRQTIIGRMEAELTSPTGDPVGVIRDALDKTSPVLSDEENLQLVGSLIQRLNVHQALVAEQAQTVTLGIKAQQEAGEKEATQQLLRGTLTVNTLERMVADDRLDPSVARSMRAALKEGAGQVSDQREKALVEIDLLNYSEEDIRDNSRLSWDDRADLIAKRRSQATGWRDTNAAQEAAGRIDRALGIVPGTMAVTLTDEQKSQRGRAMTQWYDAVEALPDADRSAQILPLANEVIKQVITGNDASELARLEQRLEQFTAGKNPEDMGANERKVYDDTVARLRQRIDKLRAKGKAP